LATTDPGGPTYATRRLAGPELIDARDTAGELCSHGLHRGQSLDLGAGSAPASRAECGVQFSPDLRDRVAEGTITVSYRLWSRPKVKVGGVYRSGSVTIVVDEIDVLPFSSITDEDLARTGEPDVETLRRRAAHAGPIHDDTVLYRVEFHVVRA
jgi:hypothetical protein